MHTDLEDVLRGSLQRQAGSDAIDVSSLLSLAETRGRRWRRRRAMAAAAGLVVAAVAVPIGVTLVSDRRMQTPSAESSAPVAMQQQDLRAAEVPGAVERPGAVGTDPWVLHFSIDDLTSRATYVGWSSMPGMERARVRGPGAMSFQIEIAQDSSSLKALAGPTKSKAVEVGGRKGTLVTAAGKGPQTSFQLTWQPTTGVWARAIASGVTREKVLRMAEAVRFDQSTRCRLPFRLGRIPAEMTVHACELGLTMDAGRPLLENAGLTIGDERRSARFRVALATSEVGEANRKIGQFHVRYSEETNDYVFVDGPYRVQLLPADSGDDYLWDRKVAMLIADFESRGKPNDPASW
jgi:hypothetical protein